MATIELVNNPTDGSSSPGGHFFGSELDNLMQGINGCGVTGHTFSATVTGSNMIVTIPAITCWVPDGSGGKVYVSYAGGDVTITAAHATLPRTDIIVIDSAGTCTATAGTATAETGDVEEAPTAALVNDEIMIAKVRVAAAVTVIGTDRVVGRAIDVSENHLGFTTKGADITSTAALPLPDAGQYFDVTGTVTVTSIESRPAGFVLVLQFDGALILTHNATTLILSGAANYTTAAGNVLTFVSEGSGNWREVSRPSTSTSLEAAAQKFVESSGYKAFAALGAPSPILTYANGTAVGLGFSAKEGTTSGAVTAHTQNDAFHGMWKFATGATSGEDAGHQGPQMRTVLGWTYEWRGVLTSAASQSQIIGAKASVGFADENWLIAFRVTDTGTLQGVCDNAGTESARDTSFTPDGTTEVTLRVVVLIGGATVRFYKDNVQVGADVTTNIPAGSLYSGHGIRNATTADKIMYTADAFAWRA